ncbi:uncharacterized protein LODBEIA_P37280 [Lodderomyces beijingensis]|uniref:Kinesin-like protein n=1 Tax=Lodderomyces beijingensis TaxID=1775926 RepID=A0ABP0ZN05_9ASCO
MSQASTFGPKSSSLSTSSTSTITTPVRHNAAAARSNYRPPSRPTYRASSPVQQPHSSNHHHYQHQPPQQQGNDRNRSRPGSSFGMSRPTTPINSYSKQEPYTGSISVSIRPNPHSANAATSQNWIINQSSNTITNGLDGTTFAFDHVFPAQDLAVNNNHQVYLKTCKPIVERFLDEGYNGTVFAYGMTGSGKTYSMKGDGNGNGGGTIGFVELAIEDIFDKIENNTEGVKYQVSMSYLEIYNERIIDLLSTPAVGNGSSTTRSDLKIRDDHEYGVKVVGLGSPSITSKEQMLSLIKKGDLNRKTSATDFNARSSRSHSILQIRLNKVNPLTNLEASATLSLCDLAGSERASTSLERRKEGSYINKSLLALSNVINKLSASTNTSGYSMDTHISYRDSKLTRLLQPALSGRSLVSILCTIHMGGGTSGTNTASSLNQSVSETYKTLRFAARAKDIVISVEKNGFKMAGGDNEAHVQRELAQLNYTIEQQRQEIMLLRAAQSPSLDSPFYASDSPRSPSITEQQLREENRVLMDKLDHLTRLTDLQRTETIIIKDNVMNDILGSNAAESQMFMANIEEFYKRWHHEMEESKLYVAHLENQLKNGHLAQLQQSQAWQAKIQGDEDLLDVLKEQEGEIMQLKEAIKDKDHIIRSFTKSSRMRKLADSNSAMNTIRSSITTPDYEPKRPAPSRGSSSELIGNHGAGKENEPEMMMIDFKLSPKKPPISSFDVMH